MTIDAERQKICANQIMGQKNEMIMVEGDLIVPDIVSAIYLNSVLP